MSGEKVETGNMTSYANNCGRLQDLISEAHSGRISESDAKIWARAFISDLESYDEVKDLAHHYGIPSVEVAHHTTIRSQILKKMVEEMLDWESAEDEGDDHEDYSYDHEEWGGDL